MTDLTETPIDPTLAPGEIEIVWSNAFASMVLVPSRNGPHVAVRGPAGGSYDGAATIVSDGSRVLLVSQDRWPIGQRTWEIPMGGIDAGEVPEAAAARELREETGLVVDEPDLLRLGSVRGSTGRLDSETHLFYVEIPDATSAYADPSEITAIAWVEAPRIVQACAVGEVKCAVTVAAILRAHYAGLI